MSHCTTVPLPNPLGIASVSSGHSIVLGMRSLCNFRTGIHAVKSCAEERGFYRGTRWSYWYCPSHYCCISAVVVPLLQWSEIVHCHIVYGRWRHYRATNLCQWLSCSLYADIKIVNDVLLHAAAFLRSRLRSGRSNTYACWLADWKPESMNWRRKTRNPFNFSGM